MVFIIVILAAALVILAAAHVIYRRQVKDLGRQLRFINDNDTRQRPAVDINRPELKALAESLGVAGFVHFLGWVEDTDSFYAALDILDERLSTKRFLFGDYVTDSDVRLFVTLSRLDIRYAHQLGITKHPLFTYKNLWPYARDLYQIPAFRNNTYFRDFANPKGIDVASRRSFEDFNTRFVNEIDFDGYWLAPSGRAFLSADPGNKFRIEK